MPKSRLVRKPTRSRAQWAALISADLKATVKATVEGTLKMGRTLIAAKQALPHGEFEKMIEAELPFSASTAQRLMKIARDPRIQKAARGQLLPAAWRTLYELTVLSDLEFEQAVTTGTITPQMTRRAAATITSSARPPTAMPAYSFPSRTPPANNQLEITAAPARAAVEEPQVVTLVPYPVAPAGREMTSVDFLGYTTLHQIERLVGDLERQDARGEVAVDAAFTLHVQNIADRLRALATRRVIHH